MGHSYCACFFIGDVRKSAYRLQLIFRCRLRDLLRNAAFLPLIWRDYVRSTAPSLSVPHKILPKHVLLICWPFLHILYKKFAVSDINLFVPFSLVRLVLITFVPAPMFKASCRAGAPLTRTCARLQNDGFLVVRARCPFGLSLFRFRAFVGHKSKATKGGSYTPSRRHIIKWSNSEDIESLGVRPHWQPAGASLQKQ